MNHWSDVVSDEIFELNYEELVRDTEAQTKRILDYCNLPFDQSCLEFYKNKRFVNTASEFQVNRPVYTDSIGRWQKYENHLGPLLKTLKKSA
jgi:hypothetical protein